MDTDLIINIISIWSFISLALFLGLSLVENDRIDIIDSKIRPVFKPILVLITTLLMLPVLVILFVTITIIFTFSYPLHLVFIKKEYQKSFKDYIFTFMK